MKKSWGSTWCFLYDTLYAVYVTYKMDSAQTPRSPKHRARVIEVLMKQTISILFATLCSVLLLPQPLLATDGPVYVGFDGAYGVKNSTSAQSIELGIKAAIHEINASGGVLGGRPLELLVKDNRSVPARGIANLENFTAQKDLVAVFGGRFSPVLLQQVKYVHEQKIPLLDVWGAADGITDHEYVPSYTFRLSLKDSWAMPAMLKRAQAVGGNKIGILLPNTGWGRSNQKALGKVLEKTPEALLVSTIWYNGGERDMLQHYQALVKSGAQAVLLVANDSEAALLVRQLGGRIDVKRVPIISHWGVTGGDMVKVSGPALAELDFSVVQTFSFFNAASKTLETFAKTIAEIEGITNLEAIESPVGVGHAYDMTHILAKAIDLAKSTDRRAIRDALEKLGKYEGLVRIYDQPFSAANHDALAPNLVFFTKFRADGALVPVSQ